MLLLNASLFHGFFFLTFCVSASLLGAHGKQLSHSSSLEPLQSEEFRSFTLPADTKASTKREALPELVKQAHAKHELPVDLRESADMDEVKLQAILDKAATSTNYMWLLGIPIALLGSTMTVTGMLVQRMSQMPQNAATTDVNEDAEKHEADAPSDFFYFLNRMWIGGFLLFAAGNMITWISLSMAPNSVLSCFNSWNIIFTLVFAPSLFPSCFPHEITRRTKFVAAMLVLGCCWVAIAGPRSYRLRTIGSLNLLFSYPAFQVCSATLGIVYIASVLRYSSVLWKVADWDTFSVAQIAGIGAISAAYAVIFSKCTSTLVSVSISSGVSQIKNTFFVYAILTFVCGLSQIHFLNVALKKGLPAFVVPCYETSAMALQIVVGGMLFQEYAQFSLFRHLVFWPGVLTVVVGVLLLCKFAEEDRAEAETAHAKALGADSKDP